MSINHILVNYYKDVCLKLISGIFVLLSTMIKGGLFPLPFVDKPLSEEALITLKCIWDVIPSEFFSIFYMVSEPENSLINEHGQWKSKQSSK